MPGLPYFSPILPFSRFRIFVRRFSSNLSSTGYFSSSRYVNFRSTSGGMQMKNCLPGDEEEMVSAD